MITADRVAGDAPEPDPLLSTEEIESLADRAPSDEALAKIEDEERRRDRAHTGRRTRVH